MLQNSFYRILSLDSSTGMLTGSIQLDRSHPVYEGHFPAKAVTPGVCQVEIIKEIFAQHLNSKMFLKEAKDIKFTNMILPDVVTNVNFKIEYTAQETDYVVKAELNDDMNVYIKMRATFETI